MMRVCHLNTCPVGIATQDPVLRERFRGTPEHVVNYLFLVAEETRAHMAALGVRTIDELIGRADLLVPDEAIEHWKARGVDLSKILQVPELPAGATRRRTEPPPGVLAVRPPDGHGYRAEDNVIVGNTLLYGATSGRAFFRGLAGERFAVRNSGVETVVEGVGDHGCEYMTGGRVVVLGPTGRNFAAGMSGGIAYVLDPDGAFPARCNTELVELEEMEDEDLEVVRALVEEHGERTDSRVAARVLDRWDDLSQSWVKVMPIDYKR